MQRALFAISETLGPSPGPLQVIKKLIIKKSICLLKRTASTLR